MNMNDTPEHGPQDPAPRTPRPHRARSPLHRRAPPRSSRAPDPRPLPLAGAVQAPDPATAGGGSRGRAPTG